MTKEMVISANRHETKVAILEDDQLVEVFFQRANEYSLAGSIHKGRVTRVLPGMQSAFVDLGLERDTFLYVSDFFEENEEYDKIAVPSERGERPRREERGERDRDRGERDRTDRDRTDRDRGDRERGDRERREAREAREERSREEHGAEEAIAAPPDQAPIAAGLAEPPAEASAEPAVEASGTDRGEMDRDRRRRSRRRRNRGRGFPESKYATPERGAPPAPVEPSVERGSEQEGEFPVLPGESLAKYRHTAVPMLDDGEQEELGAASAAEEHALDHAMPEPNGGEEESESGAESGSAEDTEVEEAAREADAEEAAPMEAAAPVEPIADEHGIQEPVDEAADELEGSAEESEGEIETAAAEDEQGGQEPEAPAASEQSGTAGNAPAAASVREQGGRYMHRVSRRLRRKMRQGGAPGGHGPSGHASGNVGQGRPEHEPRRERESESGSVSEAARAEARSAARGEKAAEPSITDLLKEGQEILVQIAKEPLGQKGARITSHIALPGRYVVYMPTLEHMGVSRKIASDDERQRLKRILQSHRAGIPGGFIVRTAGEGKSEEDIASDMSFLCNLWMDIRQKAEKKPAPALLHHDLDIVQRLLRDQLKESFKSVWVDNEDTYESVLRFVQRFQPALVNRVKLYTRPAPIFDAFNITQELEKALRPKVWLKSGGYIVINQTEALVAIDVNTGKYVGKSNRLEDTIVKTNTEAVKEIVRQIRLRDLGGIIVVDFIDMDERKNRQKVMQALEEAMRADKAPYKILQFNDFGLVAITRKRVKQSLERALCSPCSYCEGAGYVKSVQTVISEILQEAHKIAKAVEGEDVILRVNPEVAKLLKSNHNHYLEELEEILRRPVMVKGDPLLHHEKFDLA